MCRRLTPGSAVRYTFTLAILSYLLLLTIREALGWVLFRSSPAKKRVLNIDGYLVSKAPCTCARSK